MSNKWGAVQIIGDFYYPFTGEKELFKCCASTVSMGGYPEIILEKEFIVFRLERPLNDFKGSNSVDNLLKSLSNSVDSVRSGISFANHDVERFNNELRSSVPLELQKKREKVQLFFDVAKKLDVPIEKKDYAVNHIPLTRRIAPISTKYNKEAYYCIKDSDYSDILASLKHTASTYERTPKSYKSMHEEDLRNTLLASLNATYLGDATGETFRNKGKTDICIERENRAAFVAECKIWTGPAVVEKAVIQLDSYLTWRDCKTALIYFVRRKDFLNVLKTAESALMSIEGMRSVYKLDRNEFDCKFFSKETIGQIIRIRVLLFNLYS